MRPGIVNVINSRTHTVCHISNDIHDIDVHWVKGSDIGAASADDQPDCLKSMLTGRKVECLDSESAPACLMTPHFIA